MKIVLAQLDPTVGDVVGNAAKILQAWREAADHGADLVVVPELAISGYSPDDMVLRPSFLEDVRQITEKLAISLAGGPPLIMGAPWQDEGKLYNAALLLSGGKIAGRSFKHELPNYACFDERRHFSAGPLPDPLIVDGLPVGVMICEDMWFSDVARHLRQKGAQLFIVLNGSPYETEKLRERHAIARARVMENELPLVYLNLVGGQDELIFDGHSFVLDATGGLKAMADGFVEESLETEWNLLPKTIQPRTGDVRQTMDGVAAKYRAIRLGLSDYAVKNGFQDVVMGLSGGIDSALVAVLAVDAFGADHVHTVMLPSVYTSRESIDDAAAVAKALGCAFSVVPIIQSVDALSASLESVWGGEPIGVTAENLQARLRGLMLMSISNQKNCLLLATGNKSEWATGYATLYGDMCGGYAPLKDLYKTEVYKVARYACSRNGAVIPEAIFRKAPTAELRPNQKDQDSLPPYEELDEILQGLIECDMSFAAVIEQGHDLNTVKKVWKMLQGAEYKRRQGPPGPKITRRHLGKDRRYPITNGYTGS
jgi:NAD+ synthase